VRRPRAASRRGDFADWSFVSVRQRRDFAGLHVPSETPSG
jgi:hypothetical protein